MFYVFWAESSLLDVELGPSLTDSSCPGNFGGPAAPHSFFAAQRGKMGWEGEVSTKDSGEISPYVWSGSFMVLPTKFGYG